MKIRKGFVSNSSSSSFVIVFDKKPTCAKDVQNYCWPNQSHITSPWSYNDDESVKVEDAAEKVWHQIKNQDGVSKKEVIGEFSGTVEVNIKELPNADWDQWEEENRERTKLATAKYNEFVKNNKGKYIYVVEFSDNEGDSVLEHGGTFDNISHESFSHH